MGCGRVWLQAGSRDRVQGGLWNSKLAEIVREVGGRSVQGLGARLPYGAPFLPRLQENTADFHWDHAFQHHPHSWVHEQGQGIRSHRQPHAKSRDAAGPEPYVARKKEGLSPILAQVGLIRSEPLKNLHLRHADLYEGECLVRRHFQGYRNLPPKSHDQHLQGTECWSRNALAGIRQLVKAGARQIRQ